MFGFRFVLTLFATFVVLSGATAARSNASRPVAHFGVASVGNGITLHCVGPAVVFVHGSLSDYSYFKPAVEYFASHGRRAIAYSRRYNPPNRNPARPGYSAVSDADDLAAFIRTEHLGRVDVIGHSYGGLTALFLATRHPELVRTLVLAEPPAVSLLGDLPGAEGARGRAMAHDIDERMIAPMRADFRRSNRVAGLAVFIDYMAGDPHAWQHFTPAARADIVNHAHEWDVMLRAGTLLPPISKSAVRGITVPVLLVSGARTTPFLRVIDFELARLLPDNRNHLLSRSGHQMLYEQPADVLGTIDAFLSAHDPTATR